MNTFKPSITKIKGLSDKMRLPRLGVIRLGLKVKSKKTGREYPKEVDYFVVPREVAEVFGERPKELDVMIPINDIEAVFPTAYKYYGSSRGLKCMGNGEIAYRVNSETKEMEKVTCHCNLLDAGCKQTAVLNVMIPRVSVGGVYQIRTNSYNSIVDVQSGLRYVSELIGRFAMVPLKLRRVKTETHYQGKKQIHYTLKIIFDYDIQTLNQLREDSRRIIEHPPQYALPAPVEDNPELDPVDVVEDDEDEATPQATPQVAEEAKREIAPETKTCYERPDPLNPVWAQLDNAKEAVPEFYEAALKKLKIKNPDRLSIGEAIALNRKINELADKDLWKEKGRGN
jgi:hypothetical protein